MTTTTIDQYRALLDAAARADHYEALLRHYTGSTPGAIAPSLALAIGAGDDAAIASIVRGLASEMTEPGGRDCSTEAWARITDLVNVGVEDDIVSAVWVLAQRSRTAIAQVSTGRHGTLDVDLDAADAAAADVIAQALIVAAR